MSQFFQIHPENPQLRLIKQAAQIIQSGGVAPGELPQSMQALGINGKGGWGALFATHPPLEERIAALRGVQS